MVVLFFVNIMKVSHTQKKLVHSIFSHNFCLTAGALILPLRSWNNAKKLLGADRPILGATLLQGYKKNFMLNSAELEIVLLTKILGNRAFFFAGSSNPSKIFILLKNYKMSAEIAVIHDFSLHYHWQCPCITIGNGLGKKLEYFAVFRGSEHVLGTW